jgi:hypothetical protein
VNVDAGVELSAELVYSGYAENSFVKKALTDLATFPGVKIRVLHGIEPAPCGSVMVITSHGEFPSHFLRIVEAVSGDKRRMIEPPTEAQYAKRVIALNKNAMTDAEKRPQTFKEALRNAHYELSGLPRPASNRKKRAHRRSGY